jgi:hypothetical protein
MSDFFQDAEPVFSYGPGDAASDGMLVLASDALHDQVAKTNPSFPLGTIMYTPGAFEVAERSGGDMDTAFGAVLKRYAHRDWGKVDPEDAEENDVALAQGDQVLGSYAIGEETVWVITEGDRALTTILTPAEY